MRVTAAKFLNRDALLVLKGKQTVSRWIAAVQEDRIITYPINTPHPTDAREPLGREIYRYAALIDIEEIGSRAARP